jgi:hypothetical protein
MAFPFFSSFESITLPITEILYKSDILCRAKLSIQYTFHFYTTHALSVSIRRRTFFLDLLMYLTRFVRVVISIALRLFKNMNVEIEEQINFCVNGIKRRLNLRNAYFHSVQNPLFSHVLLKNVKNRNIQTSDIIFWTHLQWLNTSCSILWHDDWTGTVEPKRKSIGSQRFSKHTFSLQQIEEE